MTGAHPGQSIIHCLTTQKENNNVERVRNIRHQSQQEAPMTDHQLEGAARELIASADLIRRGFEVFRTVCPNSSFDLVAHKNGILLCIEVRGDNTKIPVNSPIGSTKGKRDADCRKFDVVAAVDGQNVRYLRSVLHTFNAASKELVGEEVVHPSTRKDHIARRDAMQHSTLAA